MPRTVCLKWSSDQGQGASDQSISLGSDFLQLDLAQAPPGGLSDWLARQLRTAISDGRLSVGARLPATRVLASELQVSRGSSPRPTGV